MDDDHDDEIPDFDLPAEESGPPFTQPDFRATYRGGRLQVIGYYPAMADNGPVTSLFGERARKKVTIADLTRHQSEDAPDELSVVFRSRGSNGDEAEKAITDWAEIVGYGRVWFPGRLVQLETRVSVASIARVKCPNCGQRWSAGGQSFWLCVWRANCFPNLCTLCGGDMPQWTVEREAAETQDGPSWEIPTGSNKTRSRDKRRGAVE